jgi:hypothetical protein
MTDTQTCNEADMKKANKRSQKRVQTSKAVRQLLDHFGEEFCALLWIGIEPDGGYGVGIHADPATSGYVEHLCTRLNRVVKHLMDAWWTPEPTPQETAKGGGIEAGAARFERAVHRALDQAAVAAARTKGSV